MCGYEYVLWLQFSKKYYYCTTRTCGLNIMTPKGVVETGKYLVQSLSIILISTLVEYRCLPFHTALLVAPLPEYYLLGSPGSVIDITGRRYLATLNWRYLRQGQTWIQLWQWVSVIQSLICGVAYVSFHSTSGL